MNNPENPSFVFPVGHHASGKSKMSEHLINEYDFSIVETGEMVRSAYKEADPGKNQFAHIGEFVEATEADDPDYFINLIIADLDRQDSQGTPPGVIINGMRTLSYLTRLQERVATHNQAIIWIESPRDVLKQRWEERERRTLSDEEFDELLAFDSRLGLDKIRPIAHADIMNDASVEVLNMRVVKVLKQLGIVAARNAI